MRNLNKNKHPACHIKKNKTKLPCEKTPRKKKKAIKQTMVSNAERKEITLAPRNGGQSKQNQETLFWVDADCSELPLAVRSV